jgi:hypothetical protein
MNKDKEIDFFSKYAHAAYDVFSERGYDRILKEFERESSKDTHPESAGFFAKVRELFE